jgi:two-component system NtrC family sensor kinase
MAKMPIILPVESTTLSHLPKVLIFDDDPSHLKLYSWILERAGFAPFTIQVGAELPRIEDHPDVDLVILDYTYRTGLNAIEVAQHIRNRWPEIKIIVLSDMMWMPDDIAAIANSFVRKGEPEQLVAKVSEMTGLVKNAAAD